MQAEAEEAVVVAAATRECSKEYVPVCAKKYGKNQTFPNACRAQASDYKIVYQGECLPAQ